ncbi:MAG: sigma-70 family RNA polymerase sigma factor [Chromatiales bacterium]|jgi:RNA polymerase sigma-70 factor (ECF subfamily)
MSFFNLSGSRRQLRNRLQQQRASLYRVAMAWCGDAMLADDLAQESLTRALAKLHQLQDEARLEHWLFRILNNCWREHLRRSRPAVELDELDDLVLVAGQSPESHMNRQQVIERVRLAVSRLPLGQRQVVTLVDLQSFSYKDVAEILEVPAGTVMSRLCRARKALKSDLLSFQMELGQHKNHLRSVK